MVKLSDTLKTYSFTLSGDYEILRSEVKGLKGINFLTLITYHRSYFEKECQKLKEGFHFEEDFHIDFPGIGNRPYRLVVSRTSDLIYIQAISLEEILEIVNTVNALEESAYTDHLTGALNRHAYDKFFLNMLFECDRHNYGVGLLFIDVDDLKYHNTKGYHVGDSVILHVAQSIGESVRRTDLIVRQGGDEFLVVFSLDPTRDITLEDVAMRIIKKVRRKEGCSTSIGGYYLKPGEVRDLAYSKTWKKELSKYIRILDEYTRSAKKYGKNRIVTKQGQLF